MTSDERTGKVNPVDDKYATAAELGLMRGFPPPPEKRVTKSNALLTPPYNRWSYLNMRMIYPSAAVQCADKAVAIDRAIDDRIGNLKVKEHGTGAMTDMSTFLERTYTDALVIIHGDKIVYEKYLNGMHADQPHQMMSCTKSFGGLLALMAIEDGKMSEDDPVVKYVPELGKAGAFSEATIGQVLDMTNSMNFTEDYADPRSGIRIYGTVLGWTDPVEGIEYQDNLYDYLVTLDIDPECAHGEIFHYQTPKTDVVNWVTNRVNQQTFREALYENVWSKIGTKGETYVLLDRNATLVAGGGLNATPNDLSRFALMMINDGRFNGQQVVQPTIIEKIAKGGSLDAYASGPDPIPGVMPAGEWSYRAQWWINHTRGMEAFTAIGIHGQWIYCDPAHKVAIVKHSSQPISKDEYLNGYDLNGFYAIIEHLAGA